MTDHAELVKRLVVHYNMTADDIAEEAADAIKALVQERDELQRKVKQYEPINTFDGLTIDQWMERAERAAKVCATYTVANAGSLKNIGEDFADAIRALKEDK